MNARIIDGKAVAASLRADIAAQVAARCAAGERAPGLAVVLVGADPASQVYVRAKHRACLEAGMVSFEHRLPAETAEAGLLALIHRLNRDPQVDGILVQLPLPSGLDARKVLNAIDPAKDVDGFHPMNVGQLALGLPGFVPCTPLGCMKLIETGTPAGEPAFRGREAIIIGRSAIVGKPMAQLLTARDATVTLAHSRSRDLPALVRRAEIVVAAVGRPEMVCGDWLRPGAVVIDVGINRVGERLVGDVAFEQALPIAGAITPVPGGVGPMTIACLLANTLLAQTQGTPAP